jgi:hypothetical protein
LTSTAGLSQQDLQNLLKLEAPLAVQARADPLLRDPHADSVRHLLPRRRRHLHHPLRLSGERSWKPSPRLQVTPNFAIRNSKPAEADVQLRDQLTSEFAIKAIRASLRWATGIGCIQGAQRRYRGT